MNSVAILGYGRFGQVLAKLLSSHYRVKVYDPKPQTDSRVEFVTLEELLNEAFLFVAVPINQFESVIQSIAPRLSSQTTVFDVCSIKSCKNTFQNRSESLPPTPSLDQTPLMPKHL